MSDWFTDPDLELIRASLLPHGAENPIVWCGRCGRHHREHTFTQDDYDAWVRQNAQRIAERIDAAVSESVFGPPPTREG